ncbi:MAG: hypothetical protein KDA89_23325, partial [Planctomycetaceae bacterium]|nr:hypothetical protein [Planctomycetaceae bacterium]
FRRCLGAKLFYTLATVGLLSLLPLNLPSAACLLISLLVAAGQPGTDPFLWFLRSRDRLDVEAGLVVAYRLILAAATLTAALLDADVVTLLLIWLVCNVLRMAAEMRLPAVREAVAIANDEPMGLNQIASTVSAAFPIGASLFLTALYPRVGILLLNTFGTDHEVSVFGTAFKLVNAAGFVSTSIVLSSFPRLVRAIESGDPGGVRQVVFRKMCLMTAVLIPLCAAGIYFAVPLSAACFPPNLSDVGRIISLLMPGLYLVCINMGIKFTLSAFGLDWYDFAAVLPGFVVFSLFTLMADGVAWPVRIALGWTCGEAAILILRLTFLRRRAGERMVISSALTELPVGRPSASLLTGSDRIGIPYGVIFGTIVLLTCAAARAQ